MATLTSTDTAPQPRQLVTRLKDTSARLSWQAVSLYRALKTLGMAGTIQGSRMKNFTLSAIRGFYTTRTIIALLNVGFFDELAQRGSLDLNAFAAEKNLDLRVLRPLVDYLYALKVLDRTGTRYRLDPQLKFPLDAVRGPFQVVYAYEDIFYNLEALLRKEKTFGAEVKRRSEFVARGSGASGEILVFPYIARLLAERHMERILDLGCGDATFLIDQCKRNPRVTGYGADVAPEAIAYGERRLQDEGLQDRVKLVVLDVFNIDTKSNQLRDIDAATSVFVIHEFLHEGKDKVVEVLRKYKSAFPGIPLVICEMIYHSPEELRQKPGGVGEIQLFHALSNQPLLTRDEWKDLFQRAGFTNVREEYLSFARTGIFTVS